MLLVRKAELEAQLKDYSTQYTDKNPKVAQTRNQLAEINRQIAQLSTGDGSGSIPANSAEARELRSLNRELERLKIELGVVQREIARKSQVAGGATDGASLPAPVVASTGSSESTRSART